MRKNKPVEQKSFVCRLIAMRQTVLGAVSKIGGTGPIIRSLFNRFQTAQESKIFVIPRKFIFRICMLLLLALLVGLNIANPMNLAVVAQLGIMILLPIPLHELAHYLVAKRFYNANKTSEIRFPQVPSTEAESEFVKKYLTPRFGFNTFYGIKSLKIIPAIFLQELNYTGRQFAIIAIAGPIFDFTLAAIYIITGLALGPMTLLGFFSTQVMLYFGVLTILAWAGVYAAQKLDLGQFRYSRIKRNAYNRFLMGLFYLGEAVLDGQGQLILDNGPGQAVGVSRLLYLFEKLKNETISTTELDLLIEAVIAANPPLSKLACIGTMLQSINKREIIPTNQMTKLETEIQDVEKALNVHGIVARMNAPVYFGLDFVALRHGVNSSTLKIQNLLELMKEKLGIFSHVPYFVAGGKLIIIIEISQMIPKRVAGLRAEREFGGFIQAREVHQERKAFRGRKSLQVGIAKMYAPVGKDYSRELAHAEVLWNMIK